MATYKSIAYDQSLANPSAMVLLQTETASDSATISFTSGIDSTYKEYIFTFNNIHPETDGADFTFNMSVDTGSNYNVTKTTTAFQAFNHEDDSDTSLAYVTGNDLAQGTGFQIIGDGVGGGVADESASGHLHIYNPSSTTFVKHFHSQFSTYRTNDVAYNTFSAGYGNTTSAVDAIQFKFAAGDIDLGTIKMYGVN